MDRRLVIATTFVVLTLLCLLLAGMSSALHAGGATAVLAGEASAPADPDALDGVALPHPSPAPAPRVAGAGAMSGGFADTHLACLGTRRAPSICRITAQRRAGSTTLAVAS